MQGSSSIPAFRGSLFVLFLWLAVAMVSAQEAANEVDAEAPVDLAQIENRLQELRNEAESLRQLNSTTREGERLLLERLQVLLEDRIEIETRNAKADDDPGTPAEDLDSLFETLIGHAPPYSLSEYDGLLDRLRASNSSRQLLQEEITFEERTLDDRDRERQEQERERRRLKEEFEKASPLDQAALRENLRIAELKLEISRERAALQRARLHRARGELGAERRAEELLRGATRKIREQVVITVEDEEASLAELDQRILRLQADLQEARSRSSKAETELQQYRAQARRGDPDDTVQTAEQAALQERLKTDRLQLSLLANRLERTQFQRENLRFRFQMWREDPERSALTSQRSNLRTLREDLDHQTQRRTSELEQTQVEQQAIQAELDFLAEEPEQTLSPWLRQRFGALAQRSQILREEIRLLASERRFAERFIDEINTRLKKVSLADRAQALWTQAQSAWNFEIFAVQDRPITIGKVLGSLLLLILGFVLARRTSALLARRLYGKLGMEESVIAALQTLTFYTFLIGVVLFALWLANIPLTVFTFLGGALAIGVGFGSQNIVNNFISGLILMIERPVKVGDLIQVADTTGLVQSIGARSTRILAGDNTHLIVPNSSFLESNVLNWTHSNTLLRTSIDVGVAYGTPTEKVAGLLLQAAQDVEKVEQSPEPEVLFIDFGDSALLFRLLFWTRIRRPTDLLRRQSELRFRIDELCRVNDIEIPFPQRDLHLRSGWPADPDRSASHLGEEP